jgi:hypothetical protein
MALEPGTDHLFAVPPGVGVGGVDDVDPDVGRRVEDRERFLVAQTLTPRVRCAAYPADCCPAKNHGRDVDTGPAQRASKHLLTLRRRPELRPVRARDHLVMHCRAHLSRPSRFAGDALAGRPVPSCLPAVAERTAPPAAYVLFGPPRRMGQISVRCVVHRPTWSIGSSTRSVTTWTCRSGAPDGVRRPKFAALFGLAWASVERWSPSDGPVACSCCPIGSDTSSAPC